MIRQGLGVLKKIDTNFFYFHLEYQPNTSNKMIYQTIPAKYLDQHTDLLEAVAEGAILRNMCKQLANTRAEELMQIESSGDALKVGKDINVLKNLEFTIDKNGPMLIEFAMDLNLDYYGFDYDQRAYLHKHKRNNVMTMFSMWNTKVTSLVKKYDVSNKYTANNFESDFSEYGAAERACGY